jgi:hypothetical protein
MCIKIPGRAPGGPTLLAKKEKREKRCLGEFPAVPLFLLFAAEFCHGMFAPLVCGICISVKKDLIRRKKRPVI